MLHRRNSWRISEAPEEDHISSAPACTELGFFYPFFDYLLVVERADLEAITTVGISVCTQTAPHGVKGLEFARRAHTVLSQTQREEEGTAMKEGC